MNCVPAHVEETVAMEGEGAEFSWVVTEETFEWVTS